MDGDLIDSLAASGSPSLLYSAPINASSQIAHHAGLKRGRDPTDDFALQLGQLAAPKLPMSAGYGDAASHSGHGGVSRLSPNNNNDTNEYAKKVKLDHPHHHHHSSQPSQHLSAGGGDLEAGGDGGEDNGAFTRVVHLRNVPNTVTEMEIIQLAMPFGKVTNVLLLKNKNQAFLEFAEIQPAATMVNFYNSGTTPPTLAGRTVFIQRSQHKELTTSAVHSNANATTQAAIQAAQAITGGGNNNNNNGGGSSGGRFSGNGPSPVLRVVVENMLYPITLDTIILIFKKYGTLAKIVTFTKNNVYQALVQYENGRFAEAAKVALNGQNIYNGCCNLRVDFSKMTDLSVRFNNDKSRDFTNPNLPSGDKNHSASSASGQSKGPNHGPSNAPGILAANPFAVNAAAFNAGASGGAGGIKMEMAPTGPPPPFGAGKGMAPYGTGSGGPNVGPGVGGNNRGINLPSGPPPPSLNPALGALLQTLAGPLAALAANNPQQAALLATLGLGLNNNNNNNINNNNNMGNNQALFGRVGGAGPGGAPGGNQNLLGGGLGGGALGAGALNQFGGSIGGVGSPGGVMGAMMGAAAGPGSPSGGSAAGVVLLVSHLPEGAVTPDDLFTLFGVYGDVVRVKILYNKKDNALIQMADGTQAHQAAQFLDKIKLRGQSIRVTPSKHTTVQLPKEGTPDGGLTKDFANSPLHRFKKPGSKNYANVFPPSATLHLSNIPPDVEESTLVDAFGRHGRVKAFKFFPKDHKMALVGLESVEAAVGALIKMHNYPLAEGANLRVSFSKSNIQM